MEKINNWTEVSLESLKTLGQKLAESATGIVGALVVIILGWIIARLVAFFVKKTLRLAKFDKLTEKLNADDMLGKANIKISSSEIVGKFVYWLLMLVFFVVASDTLGWTVVSESISDLIAYLPRLFSGVVIFVIGLYIANFVKRALKGIFESLGVKSGHIVSSFTFYLILVIITLTALTQAGVDTTILTSNVTIIIGGIVLAFAVSFGIGSKDVLTNILSSFYSKNNFKVGLRIKMGDIEGTIDSIDNISCVIKTDKDRIVLPVRRLLEEQITIIEG